MTEFQNYINELQQETAATLTEHSKRAALEILLKSVAAETNDKIKVLHEPRRKENYGAPDFLVYTNASIIGYVENKKLTENPDKTLKTQQIKKYTELSDNILLTNYIEFVWIKGGNKGLQPLVQRETLCTLSDLENHKLAESFEFSESAKKVNDLITKFLSQPPVSVASVKELAVALAVRSKNLKTYLLHELERQEREEQQGRLFGLFRTFKDNVSNDLSLTQFADAFAQMLVYGLFLAKLNADTKEVTLYNAKTFIPKSFQLIRELVSFFDELEKDEYKETRWIIEETISIMNNLELSVINQQLSFKTNKTTKATDSWNDPYIYFYEDFLTAYDNRMRKAKGVYYTPPQVVFFIVSAINQLLISDFKLPMGLAQHDKVTALDFATGTGTFLTEIFRQVLHQNPKSLQQTLIKDHLLKNIYGFEYLIAPYTIAHLKLSQLLKESGYELSNKERLQVYLTNTLEPAYAKKSLFLPELSQEGELAKQVKENPVLVVTGNPPYSISSSNKDAYILNLLNDYKKGLNERKINLDDDYIKFIRFAHDKIARYGQGIVAVITNNSFLDGITHRRMRESLLNDFDKIYIINLHGSSLKKEGDENVFDIRVGVAISILVKTPKPLKNKQVYYFSTKENGLIERQKKFGFLLHNGLNETSFEKIEPEKPNFWFVKKDLKHKAKYDKYLSVKSVFKLYHSGIQTGRDSLIIDFDTSDLYNRVKEVVLSPDEKMIRQKFQLNDTSGWNLERFKSLDLSEKYIEKILYRPFDKRFIYYENKALKRDRNEVFQHFVGKNNIGLVMIRKSRSPEEWNFSFVSDALVNEGTTITSLDNNYIFPLYTYISNGDHDENGNGYLFKEETKQDNFTRDFRKYIRTKYTVVTQTRKTQQTEQEIDEKNNQIEELKTLTSGQKNPDLLKNLKNSIAILEDEISELKKTIEEKDEMVTEHFSPSPEQVLGYIYAILHSPAYREKYAEFLKFDFPRIPFCNDAGQFQQLSNLGWDLIQVHLLNKIPEGNEYDTLATYTGHGDNVVQKPEHKNNKLYINKQQYFDGVAPEIYAFRIGAYQVLYKYLKDRNGRTLSHNEIMTITNTVKALKFTMNQKKRIFIETRIWI